MNKRRCSSKSAAEFKLFYKKKGNALNYRGFLSTKT